MASQVRREREGGANYRIIFFECFVFIASSNLTRTPCDSALD